MLRIPLRQCSRKLQSCPARSLSVLAASPARTAITTCRRPLALAQRRNYAIAAEDTNKGVVCWTLPPALRSVPHGHLHTYTETHNR